MLGSLARRFFGTANDRLLKPYFKTVEVINGLEPEFEKLDDDQLRAKTEEFRTRLKEGESLDDLLPEPLRRFARRPSAPWDSAPSTCNLPAESFCTKAILPK